MTTEQKTNDDRADNSRRRSPGFPNREHPDSSHELPAPTKNPNFQVSSACGISLPWTGLVIFCEYGKQQLRSAGPAMNNWV